MFLVLSAARMRRRLTTSASLKSNEMSREPFDGCRPAGRAGVGVAWAMRTGAGGGGATSALAGASAFAGAGAASAGVRSEEHTSELQSHSDLVCRLLLEKKILQ